ncbi:MAG: tetratricopeptide repeat protein [Pseudomonadota bacterium]
MPFIILSLIVQVAVVIHIIKTGRNTTWIWVVMLLPGAGSIAYLVLEVLPDLMGTRTARRASRGVGKVINPNRDINASAQDYAMSDTVQNSVKLADECMGKGLYSEAKGLYEKALSGFYADDPDIMFGLARAQFALDEHSDAKTTLDALIEKNPDYKNQHAHLLFARTVEALGDAVKALEEYEVLDGYFSGAEARYRYACFLQTQGQTEKANSLFNDILDYARTAGSHYRDLNREWLGRSKKALMT